MTSELSDKFLAYHAAAREYSEARSTCEYDCGYFLHREERRLKEAEQDFVEALQKRLAEKPNQS